MSAFSSDLPYRPCVGVVLVNAQGLVFTGQRIDSPTPAWQMPQGGIDPGETPREAALRELFEETGVRADLVDIEGETDDWLTYELPRHLIGKIWGGKYRGQEQKWFLMRFRGSDGDIDITAKPREFSSWRWMPPEDLAPQIVVFKRQVYEAVVRAFAGHF